MQATVLIALLQPAPEVYNLFDDILLLAEGHVIFHGPKEEVWLPPHCRHTPCLRCLPNTHTGNGCRVKLSQLEQPRTPALSTSIEELSGPLSHFTARHKLIRHVMDICWWHQVMFPLTQAHEVYKARTVHCR